ncbi:Imidazolonepropionase [Colwellia chukchiensis]|uniref:Imidazolonepropionase n=1 Tax=Colwellia chukchiensis TaxID=641665 RepID=A0A1H7MP68_9GAMM|nr:amidohydrolase family protein [Colwellia chukchiensis]SEL12648.1 Imidazolonepropionase [Colwellia chukchiensis]
MQFQQLIARLFSAVGVVFLAVMATSFFAKSDDNLVTDRYLLINNVDVFDGVNPKLIKNSQVLVINDEIAAIGSIPDNLPSRLQIIDGQGNTLMPGLIDAHWHTLMAAASFKDLSQGDASYLHTLAAVEASNTLLRGFTTVRDMAGPAFGLKKAIDENLLQGPRIYPSGAGISQTSGHGDIRHRFNPPKAFGGAPSRWESLGLMSVADGEAGVLTAVREQLRQGAVHIKIMGGGGVASIADPLDSVQFTQQEIKAAVQAAADFGTYVTAHIYTAPAAQRAIAAGVKSIEHGHLLDDKTLQLMANKGVWLSTQPFHLDEVPAYYNASQKEKLRLVTQGTAKLYRLAKKYKVKVAFGTDLLFATANAAKQNQELVKLQQWLTPFEILNMATANNGELLRLTGARNPYPKKLGVVAVGAYADLILVKGDPLANINLLADPKNNIAVIIKNGTVIKNTLTTRH